MVVLELPPGIEAAEVRGALENVLVEYRNKVERARKGGLLYMWSDAMSGTVRCSFCEKCGFDELPFRAPISRAASLDELADSLSDVPAEGIPRGELAEVEWSEPDDTARPELLVFATTVEGPHQ